MERRQDLLRVVIPTPSVALLLRQMLVWNGIGALILRAYVHAIPPVTWRAMTILVRIEGAIHPFPVECLSANRASIDVGWPLMSGSR
jgi:hypothetical protein